MEQNLIPSLVCTEKDFCITPRIMFFFLLVVATLVEQLKGKAKMGNTYFSLSVGAASSLVFI